MVLFKAWLLTLPQPSTVLIGASCFGGLWSCMRAWQPKTSRIVAPRNMHFGVPSSYVGHIICTGAWPQKTGVLVFHCSMLEHMCFNLDHELRAPVGFGPLCYLLVNLFLSIWDNSDHICNKTIAINKCKEEWWVQLINNVSYSRDYFSISMSNKTHLNLPLLPCFFCCLLNSRCTVYGIIWCSFSILDPPESRKDIDASCLLPILFQKCLTQRSKACISSV